jgi:hypothetical protein
MYRNILSILLVFVSVLLPQNSLNVTAAKKDPITISMRNNALNAAVKFLSGQKNCITEDMIQYSVNIQHIENLNEYYQSSCKGHPLQNAEITDLVVVSSELALVSTKLDYLDRVIVQTSPIIKVDGKWKLVKGINQGLATASSEDMKPEILEGIEGYFTSIRSSDNEGLEKYGKVLGKDDQNKKHLLTDKTMKSLAYKANRIKMVSESVAVAAIEKTIDGQSNEIKYVIYQENDIWKVIADRHLLTTTIPKNANPVEVK